MSAHGISPAWVSNDFSNQEFAFGDPWLFDPQVVMSIFLNCGLVVGENDFEIDTLAILLGCNFLVDRNDFSESMTIGIGCDFIVDQNTFSEAMTVSLSCFTETV